VDTTRTIIMERTEMWQLDQALAAHRDRPGDATRHAILAAADALTASILRRDGGRLGWAAMFDRQAHSLLEVAT
jgi:protein involved in temperature-dependent protein secretion